MTVRVGINGFGRVGRSFLRIARRPRCRGRRGQRPDRHRDAGAPAGVRLDLRPARRRGHRRGRRHRGRRPADRRAPPSGTPPLLDWAGTASTSSSSRPARFRSRDDAALHLKAGARKVLISAPGKDADVTLVLGVNDGDYDPVAHDVISNASCTTNCVAPMGKVLHEAFGIETRPDDHDPRVHQRPGHCWTRRTRTCAGPGPPPSNIIPTITGAARAAGLVIPDLAGRLDGLALRVPVEDGSLTDLTVLLEREVTVEEVNAAFAGRRRRTAGGRSSATAPSRSCPATSSATRRRASSTPA